MPRITFRLTEEELIRIDEKSYECGMSRSQYVRQTAIGVIPKSKLDKQIIHQLFLLHGDIGRLGGLFKLWLTRSEDKNFHQKMSISELVFEINKLKDLINNLVLRL